MNRWAGIGRLTRDPELKFTNGGVAVCNISIACTSRIRKKDGEWYEAVSFIPIVVWGKRGESCAEHLTKGAMVYVEGRYETRKWEKDGKTNYSTEIVATDVNFLHGKSENAPSDSSEKKPNNAPPTTTTDDEDLPF